MSGTPFGPGPVRVMVATDRSETATRAVDWARDLADRYGAELHLVQVLVPSSEGGADVADTTMADVTEDSLRRHAAQLAGDRGHAHVVVSSDPAMAIVGAAESAEIDVLVVGNVGMAGRKEFLLGNVPNRISHNARCTVVIVNTAADGTVASAHAAPLRRTATVEQPPRLLLRGSQIGGDVLKTALRALRTRDRSPAGRRRQAELLRGSMERLGPTFAKIGQILSTRPDLLPPEFIDELATLQDHVPALTEAEVVEVMERELGVPWEDVFESIDPQPLAAASIGQVHRARLASGDRVVVKVQRPNARHQIHEDLALLEIFVSKASKRPRLNELIDLGAVFKHLSESLERELDYTREAANLERMGELLEGFDRLGVPAVHRELSSSRLLVMEEIEGVPISDAPEGPARKEAARQLLESYYKQIMTDGFFHADPHPGNLMWWNDRIYFLDFGMVGEVDAGLREQMILLLMAFWQEDASFLTDVTLTMAGADSRRDLDVDAFQRELAGLMARYRSASLRDIQLGPILQEMSEISIRYRVPLPSELTLTGKALAQMQLATARLDPDLDPFEVAGRFLMREVVSGMRGRFDLAGLFYQIRRFQVRFIRVVEAVERLIGARPGERLEVNFRAGDLEATVRRGARRIAFALTAGAAFLATGLLTISDRVSLWAPSVVGAAAALLTLWLIVDIARGK